MLFGQLDPASWDAYSNLGGLFIMAALFVWIITKFGPKIAALIVDSFQKLHNEVMDLQASHREELKEESKLNRESQAKQRAEFLNALEKVTERAERSAEEHHNALREMTTEISGVQAALERIAEQPKGDTPDTA